MSTRTSILLAVLTLAARPFAQSIPSYVVDYAPYVYIDINDPYQPSDIGAQITNTNPELNFTRIDVGSTTLELDNLSTLNSHGQCTPDAFDECSVFLTSKENVSTSNNPAWLYGITPNSEGETVGAISCAVIVNDHGGGTVDAFYFYFYAFNLGENFSSIYLGNHVGDWEHTMLRFVDEKPETMYFSAHDAGYVYTYDAVSKINNTRPISYASLGGHANYPTPGLQARHYGTLTLNDYTSPGPLWDPVASAYFYTFAPNSSSIYNGTFTPMPDPKDSSGALPPVDWLYFLGRWGDKQYPDSNPLQINIENATFAWESGPTGPLDKNLNRNGSCPADTCTTTTTLPVPSGNTDPSQTIVRTEAPAVSTSLPASTTTGTATGSSSGSAGATATSKSNAARMMSQGSTYILTAGAALWLFPI